MKLFAYIAVYLVVGALAIPITSRVTPEQMQVVMATLTEAGQDLSTFKADINGYPQNGSTGAKLQAISTFEAKALEIVDVMQKPELLDIIYHGGVELNEDDQQKIATLMESELEPSYVGALQALAQLEPNFRGLGCAKLQEIYNSMSHMTNLFWTSMNYIAVWGPGAGGWAEKPIGLSYQRINSAVKITFPVFEKDLNHCFD